MPELKKKKKKKKDRIRHCSDGSDERGCSCKLSNLIPCVGVGCMCAVHMYILAYVLNVMYACVASHPVPLHMWQSRIEIEYYSIAYFERITEFDAH